MVNQFSDRVRVEDPTGSGRTEVVYFLAGPRLHDGNEVVWVCDDVEWAISEREGRDPKGTAWPAALVHPAGGGAA